MTFKQYLAQNNMLFHYNYMSYSLRKKILLDYVLEGLTDIEGATT